jgi:hypothetical protein
LRKYFGDDEDDKEMKEVEDETQHPYSVVVALDKGKQVIENNEAPPPSMLVTIKTPEGSPHHIPIGKPQVPSNHLSTLAIVEDLSPSHE